MEFWNDVIVEKSYSLLVKLKGRYDFVLIGGWAVYLYTRSEKSKDIDIIVDYPELQRIAKEAAIKKNERLKKYEISIEGVSIGIYLPYYSKLALPVEKIMENVLVIEGFKVPKIEYLLALKQQAELDRKASVKGMKDRIDILSLLLSGNVHLDAYAGILGEHKNEILERLKTITNGLEEYRYLGIADPRKIKKTRKKLRDEIESMIWAERQ